MYKDKIINGHGKKAKVSIEMLIGLVILVLSTAIIIYLLSLFYFNPVIDKEVCHQSVVIRATGPLDSTKGVPLKCQTEKNCLTMSGDNCIELSSTKNNPVIKEKITKCNDNQCVESKKEIMELFADRMVKCHDMLGRGKLKFFPSEWFSREKKVYGLICNRVVFDDEIKDQIDSIGYGEFYNHLESKQVFDEESQTQVSALEYLYPGWKQSRDSVQIFKHIKEEGQNEGSANLKDIDFIDWKLDIDKENGFAIIAMEAPFNQGEAIIKSTVAAGAVIGVSILSVVALPVGIIAGGTILAVGTGTGVATGGAVLWYNYNDEFDYSPPAIVPYDIEILKGLGVSVFEIAP